MKDTSRQNERKRSGEDAPDESLAELMSSYTPKQREAFLKGLRILARVAIRAHMKRVGAEFEAEQRGGAGRSRDDDLPSNHQHCDRTQDLAGIFRHAVYLSVRYLVMETGVRRYTDEHGNEVRLTDERLRHILRRHPEMAFQLHRFAETLATPDAVRVSITSILAAGTSDRPTATSAELP